MIPPVGKSGPFDMLGDPVVVHLRVLDERDVHDPAEVVRRHLRRHPDGYAIRAVDEQVREARRQDRLADASPKFGEVDGVRAISRASRSPSA